MLELIHMTATYSNAMLVAVLPQVSDFSKKLELPIPQPITAQMVTEFRPSRYKDLIGGGVMVSSNYLFSYSHGAVDSFRSSDNVYYDQDPTANLPKYVGKENMTTNDALVFARDTLRKLGYDPNILACDVPPRSFHGPQDTKDGRHVPYCQMRWERYAEVSTKEQQDDDDIVTVEINMDKKTLVGLHFVSNKIWRDPPKVGVEPVLESDIKKHQFGPMFKKTNAPPRMPN